MCERKLHRCGGFRLRHVDRHRRARRRQDAADGPRRELFLSTSLAARTLLPFTGSPEAR